MESFYVSKNILSTEKRVCTTIKKKFIFSQTIFLGNTQSLILLSLKIPRKTNKQWGGFYYLDSTVSQIENLS